MHSACTNRPATSTGLAPRRSASVPSSRPSAEPGETGHAVDGDRSERGDAADHGVAHHVEDRPGMRGAAGEMRQRQRDELRRAQRLRHGPFGLRRLTGTGGRVAGGLRRRAHQEAGRDQQRPGGDADHQHRRAPVIARDQPACGRRDRHRRDAHAGGDQRDCEAAVLVDPRTRERDHWRIEAAGGNPDQHAEDKLKLPQGLRLARRDQADAEQHAAGQHHDARAEAVGQRAPGKGGKSHEEEIQRRRGRDAGTRPSHRFRNRRKEDSERQHGAEANAGHQRTGCDDDPAIVERGGLGGRRRGLAHAFPRAVLVVVCAMGW